MRRASTRAYHSPRRELAAAETRAAVLAAAREEFVSRGYSATSLAAIADTAGVSLATVKLVAGTKAQLLSAAIHALMRRDDTTRMLREQPWWRELLAERDPERLIDRFAAVVRSALDRQAGLFEVVWQAAPSEPELAELERRGSLGRRDDARQVVLALSSLGALAADTDVDTATDTVWAIASPQVHRLLVTRRKWTSDRWEAWLRDVLRRQLLRPARRTRQAPS